MPIKTILSILGVDQDATDLVNAAELSERSGAHLTAVIVGCVPPAPFGEVAGGVYSSWSLNWEAENERLEIQTQKLRDLLEERRLHGDVRAAYCLQGTVEEEIGNRARYADVSLIGAGLLADDFLLKRVLGGALFRSPTPVILTSKEAKVELAPRTILVAWNAGLEAGRALRSSLDMLVGAENVHLALVDPAATTSAMGEEPGADIAAFLARHGVKTTVDRLASCGRQTDAVLRQHALDIDAGLIVMGAYSHSRLQERIFGGTTTSMIETPGTPVLLAH
jgi:nucleotide-binding universal stress UspA family protein